MDTTTKQGRVEVDVLVVGAGPTGLMLANWLARLGVDHLVVDGKEGPTRESRAIVVHARSMEIYAQLGLIDDVLERATFARDVVPGFEARATRRGIPLQRLGHGLSPYPGIHILEQSANEEILLTALRARRGRDDARRPFMDAATGADRAAAKTAADDDAGDAVCWRTRVDHLQQEADAVAVRLSRSAPDGTPGVTTTVRARYVVGCDGASSTVRHQAGIAFTGRTKPDVFWVLDASGVTGLPDGAVNVRPGSDRFLVGFPLGRPGRARLIGTFRGEAPTLEAATRDLRERFGVTYADAAWFSSYRLHYRIADRFRSGRVFVAGDAAHVHSPVGGQGMNTGLQDAHNLAFALGDVLSGAARESRLDHYGYERRPVATRLVATTDRMFDAVTDPRPRSVRLRRALAPALPVVLPAVVPRLPISGRLAGYVGQTRIHYWRSEGERRAARGRRDPVVGRRLPFAGDNHAGLSAAQWQVHVHADGTGRATSAGVGPADLPGRVGSVHTFAPRPDLGLEEGTVLLVRPDGFVAQRARLEDPDVADVFAAALTELGVEAG